MKHILPAILLLTTLFAKAQNENALSFDNVDDYVTVPGASGLIANSSQISLSCWIYPEHSVTTFPDYDGFCGLRNNTDDDFYMIQIPGDLVEARFRNSAGLNFDIIDSNLQLNTWQHYILTYDGTELTLYRNGVLSGSIAASGTISNTLDSLYIGDLYYQGTDFFLQGQIDEVSLWNKTVSSNEAACIYKSYIDSTEIGLLLYYKFNQGIAGGINITTNSVHPSTGSINGIMHNFTLSGTTSNWVSGIENYTNMNDVICSGQTYTFGAQSLTAPGIYYETLQGSTGCDSIIRLYLNPVVNDSVSVTGAQLHCYQAGGAYQWLDCDNGFAPVAGANNQDYISSVSGNFAVAVTYNGCTDTSYCYDVILGGVADINDASLNIYPNPASSLVNFPARFANSEIKILDATGREVICTRLSDKSILDVKNLEKGFYHYSLPVKNKIVAGSFIRE
jgi:hypothetical protein